MTSTRMPIPATGLVAGDLSVGVLVRWGGRRSGLPARRNDASPWFGARVTDGQAHHTAVYLAVAVALSLAAPTVGLVVALWTEWNPAAVTFSIALTLSVLGDGYLC